MTTTEEQEDTAPTMAPPKEPDAAKRAHSAAHKAKVAAPKAKSGQKVRRAKNSAHARRKAGGARPGSKTAKVLDLLQRSGGATLKDLIKATGWQAHSVRGFLSGALAKKMGLPVISIKNEDGERRYSVKA